MTAWSSASGFVTAALALRIVTIAVDAAVIG
jgi:hypothetical protein